MTSNRDPLVSVVTPVYNGEEYLHECIESVLAQTYANWDYTIVNNCSTDRTLEIAQKYLAKDRRIRIHCNPVFIGAVENYNNALRQVSPKSKYVKVVAADDWLFPECLERMVLLAEKHPNVAIVGAYGLRGNTVMWQGLPYCTSAIKGRDICRFRLLGGPYVFGTATSLLYKSEIVRCRHSFYNESNVHSDSEVCLEILETYDFGFVHQILTGQGEQSESRTAHSELLQTYLPWILYELVHYGPKYLNKDELRKRIDQQLWTYYHYLGEQVFRLRSSEFWTFHCTELARLGYPLSSTRLATYALSFLVDLVFNPKMTGNLMCQLRRSFSWLQ